MTFDYYDGQWYLGMDGGLSFLDICLSVEEKPRKNLNLIGRPRDLNPGPPECEFRALPWSHLAWVSFVSWYVFLFLSFLNCFSLPLIVMCCFDFRIIEVPCLAKKSACSFPCKPTWDGTHCNTIFLPWASNDLYMYRISSMTAVLICWLFMASIADFESISNTILFSFMVLWSIRMSAVAMAWVSASNTVDPWLTGRYCGKNL